MKRSEYAGGIFIATSPGILIVAIYSFHKQEIILKLSFISLEIVFKIVQGSKEVGLK